MKLFQKVTAVILAAALSCALIAGCSGSSNISNGVAAKDYPITIQEVTISKKPEGVVVLSDNLADVILTMGYEITLKGKSASCTQEDLSILPDMTIDSVDAMKSAGVTLVLTDSEPTEAQRTALENAGIQALVIAPATSREDLTRLYTQVGSAMNGGKTGYTAAQRAAESSLLSVDEVARLVPEQTTPPTACYLYELTSAEQAKAVTGDMLASKLMEYAGLTNNFSDSTGGTVDIQSLTYGNPDYIFCAPGLKDSITATYPDLNAVKNNRIYELDASYMNRQGHTLFETVGKLASTVYPELLESGSASNTSSSTSSAVSSTVSSQPPASSSSQTSSAPASSSASSSSSTVSAPPTSIQQAGVLQKGDTGAEVLKMQQRLDELGYMYVAPNGNFNANTAQCVKDFQLYNGLEVTGIVDAKTSEKMYASDVKAYPGNDR